MEVYRLINQPVDSNCFVIIGELDNTCIVVDPGTEDCKNLFSLLNKYNLEVKYVYITHEHIDHIIGCVTLKQQYNYKLICSDQCASLLNNSRYNLSRIAEQFTEKTSFPVADIVFSDKLMINWQNCSIYFYKMLGHSEGSSMAQIGNEIFVGDTIIKAYKTVTTLPGGSKKNLLFSLERLLINFDNPDMIVNFGHFESCTMMELIPEIKEQISYLKGKLLYKTYVDNTK